MDAEPAYNEHSRRKIAELQRKVRGEIHRARTQPHAAAEAIRHKATAKVECTTRLDARSL